jgi:hypothetical protein
VQQLLVALVVPKLGLFQTLSFATCRNACLLFIMCSLINSGYASCWVGFIVVPCKLTETDPVFLCASRALGTEGLSNQILPFNQFHRNGVSHPFSPHHAPSAR